MAELDVGVAPERLVTKYPQNLAETLTVGYMGALKAVLAKELTKPDFSTAQIIPAFQGACDSLAGVAVQQAVQAEYYNNFSWSADKQLGPLAATLELDLSDFGPPEVPDDVTVSPTFVSSFRDRLRNLPDDFSYLDYAHGVLKKDTPYIDLIRAVQAAYDNRTPTDGGTWRNVAYDLVEGAVQDFDSYSLSASALRALQLVTFLQVPRPLTRRILTGATFYGTLKHNIGLSKTNSAALGALKEYFITDAMEGQHWFDQHYTRGLDSQHFAKITAYNERSWDALGVLQTTRTSNGNTYFMDQYEQTKALLRKAVDCDNGRDVSSIDYWRSQDIGHCFKNFNDWYLDSAISDSGVAKRDVCPPKNGTKAVIFEDDVEQMQIFQRLVTNHSPQVVTPENCFKSEAGLLESALDPNNTLFVIDIENGDDKDAGIRLAQQILWSRMAIEDRMGNDAPKTEIVLWSMSMEAIDRAVEYYQRKTGTGRRYIESLGIEYSVGGTGSSGSGRRIKFEVKAKKWD